MTTTAVAATAHSLAFRVMRLCRPSLHVDSPLRFPPADLLLLEDIDYYTNNNLFHLPKFTADDDESDPSFRSRLFIDDEAEGFESTGVSVLLVLPQSFGTIYLGETFCSYVSVNNSSAFENGEQKWKTGNGRSETFPEVNITLTGFGLAFIGVGNRDDFVVVSKSAKVGLNGPPGLREFGWFQAEIQTERQRVLLLDTSKSPVESIRAGGRYDFIVEHDIKELRAHTLVCTALYYDHEGDRKHLPQFFKFIVANPLSVRTKVRVVKETFLEACIENHTKSNLFMDQVEFQPAQHWTATVLKADIHHTENNAVREIFKPPTLMRYSGGIHNFLYQLKFSTQGSAQAKADGSNILGKLQITWRTNLGEPGRLQTQQILGSPILRKDIDLQVLKIPSAILLQSPFVVQLNLSNQTDRKLGPFEVWLSTPEIDEDKAVMINGLQIMNLIALKLGIQKVSGIVAFDTSEKKTYEPIIDLEHLGHSVIAISSLKPLLQHIKFPSIMSCFKGQDYAQRAPVDATKKESSSGLSHA
ncbi:Trafficking protein particle complex subunit 13-like protein [Drosera capensis]